MMFGPWPYSGVYKNLASIINVQISKSEGVPNLYLTIEANLFELVFRCNLGHKIGLEIILRCSKVTLV